MYCAHCGNGLGEEQVCSQCGWSFGEVNILAEQFAQPSTGDGAAITSLVCGILSWMLCGGFVILPIIGIIFGMMGLKSRQSEIATAGIVINVVVLVISALVILLFVAMVASGGGPSSGGGGTVVGGRCC